MCNTVTCNTVTHEVIWQGKRYPCMDGYFQIGMSSLDNQRHWFFVDRATGDYELVSVKQMLKLYSGVVYVAAKPMEFAQSRDFARDAKEYVRKLSKRNRIEY